MSGHSKWATIKRAKAANDAKRGKLFTKIGREIAVAVREGGPDPDMNIRLDTVLDKAKQANMPKDNIERAIKRGMGVSPDGGELEERIYEGYGPHGTALMVHVLTDNVKRAVSDIRHSFSRYGGNLGSDGCVAWMFDRKGYITIKFGDSDPEELALMAIDAGAEDVEIGDEMVEIYTDVENTKTVQDALSDLTKIENTTLAWMPQSHVTLSEKDTVQTMKLIEALEDLDDVQEVFSNLEIADEVIARFEAEAA
jgi:YebC/PmpR family DNA-binding regulatory protein